MKTTAELINELQNTPPGTRWYGIKDEDEGMLLLSEYTGDIANAQLCINIDDIAKDEYDIAVRS